MEVMPELPPVDLGFCWTGTIKGESEMIRELFIAFVMLINRGGYSVAERCVQQVQGKVWLSDLWETFRREALNAD